MGMYLFRLHRQAKKPFLKRDISVLGDFHFIKAKNKKEAENIARKWTKRRLKSVM